MFECAELQSLVSVMTVG